MESPAAIAAALALKNFDSWRNVELRVSDAVSLDFARGATAWTHIDERYVESRAGGRVLDTRFLMAGKTVRRTTDYSDGEKSAFVNYRDHDPGLQNGVVIQRHFGHEDQFGKSSRPVPLEFYYVSRAPLHEALPKAIDLGADRVIGRECRAFLFESVRYTVGKQDLVYYLDAKTATPLKVVSFADAAARAKGKALWAWTTEKFVTKGGREVSEVSTVTSFADDGKTANQRNTFTVESIRFDKEYPATTFWPAMQPGIAIYNAITNTFSKAPGVLLPPTRTETLIPPPGSIAMAGGLTPASSIALGFAVLLAGGLLSWRRR